MRPRLGTALLLGLLMLQVDRYKSKNITSPEQKRNITFAVIVPDLTFKLRMYNKKIQDAVKDIETKNKEVSQFKVIAIMETLPKVPSPTKILDMLCNKLLPLNIMSIMYFTNADLYGNNTASAQYVLHLTGYLGIPVVAWNADNIGLEQRISASHVLQLAPSMKHLAKAMMSILRRYSWHQFSIVTTLIGGHEDFVKAVRDEVLATDDFTYNILDVIVVKSEGSYQVAKQELEELAGSESRVILLYTTESGARVIFNVANELHLTGKSYVWIVPQSVIGSSRGLVENMRLPAFPEFPVGTLGIYFNTSTKQLEDEIWKAIHIFGKAIDLLMSESRNLNISLESQLNCSKKGDIHWNMGEYFYKYLRRVKISKSGDPTIEFNLDGTLKNFELQIMNLDITGFWNKIGVWGEDGLTIKDIVWPGDSPVPPPGQPEKFNLKVSFMEEPPFVNLMPPDNETGECKTSRSVRCRVTTEAEVNRVNYSVAIRNPKYYMCCSGFCIDLLQKFANELHFSFELYRVEDGIWGVLNNGKWNGLMSELLSQRADAVVTSFKINSERQVAVDFTVPFMGTGIAIVVAKKTGIISPKAFLEPFDTISWLMILLLSIQVAAFAIFFFEWLSPSGYDMKMLPPREHRFSLFRTYWLVWAILFGAAVNVDCPRGYTSRFMSNVWAMFAVVFLAIYTANLAAFMITREEFYDLTGIEDERLYNPRKTEPPFRYGTIPFGNTETVLRRNKPHLFYYMRSHNRSDVNEGIKSVKKGDLDAFIYDATVLEYRVGQDNECRLLTVGSWYAMTGYAFALPKKSKYLNMFNRKMIECKENGDIERLQRFWLQGVCKPQHQKRNASNPLDTNQFMSAFLLLGCGIVFTVLLLGLEHIYFRYCRKHLAKKDRGGCFTLVSLSMGKSITFRGAVYEAQDMIKHHRCKDPVCDTQLWKARHQLDMARLKIQQLEAELRGNRYYPIEDALKPRDLTRNHITTNEPVASRFHAGNYYNPLYTEIAEIETVL